LGTSPDEERQLKQIESERSKRVEQAFALFKRNPDYPSVVVQIDEQDREIDQSITPEAKERLSAVRFEHLFKYVGVRGKTYLRLITDLESVDAFAIVMDDFSRVTWWQFSMVPIESIPPTLPFSEALPIQRQRDVLRNKERDWVVEAHRRLASMSLPSSEQGAALEAAATGVTQESLGPLRGLQHFADAEYRAQAQIHYEGRLEELRKQQELTPAKLNRVSPPKHETVGEQIDRLRDECDLGY
jgi:hypothetical protein